MARRRTITDVACEAQVSMATVHRVLTSREKLRKHAAPPAILVVMPRPALLADLGHGVRVLSDHPLGVARQPACP